MARPDNGWRVSKRFVLVVGGACLLAFWLVVLSRYWEADGRTLTAGAFILYVLGTFLGWLNVALWREGPSYYPAGRLLALATGLPGAFYSGLFVVYRFNLRGMQGDVLGGHWNIILYGGLVACQLYSAYLLVRQNFFARPGGGVDAAGHERPPSAAQVDEYIAGIRRAHRHDMLGRVQVAELRDLGVLPPEGGRPAAVRFREGRQGREGRG